MPLTTDTTLGSYKIESLIGKGGMGEVYLARDTGLDRQVAIKVLPESFASDSERVARFEREARLLATLSHQNIAGIYGLEETDGIRFLVLELVEGQTLKNHLSRGAAPIEETLRICRQIADAVSAAHERGVIHRDLKPANIMITADDTIKVLDFGIAKALGPGVGTGSSVAATLSFDHLTAANKMVGTPSYMSPEQARGKPIDKRSDIWSFGCVLYECLAGRTAFGGETVTDTLARILERDPDYTCIPAATPPTVQTLLRRCLQKNRKNRLHDIGDARVQIDEAIADPSGTTLGLSGTYTAVDAPRSKAVLPWLLTAVFALLAAGAWLRTGRTPDVDLRPAATTRLAFVSPDVEIDWEKPDFDLSPDGRRIVFTARPLSSDDAEKPPPQLFWRRFDEFDSTAVPGTERARQPKFSPSGRWIAFFSYEPSAGRTLLKRVALDGSPAITICDVTEENYGLFIWLSEDTLMVSRWTNEEGSKATVSVDSGLLETVILNTDSLEDFVGIGFSSVLPGGKTVLGGVFRLIGTQSRSDAIIVSMDDWTCRKVLDNAAAPRYTPGGRLVFLRDRTLLAVPFEASSSRITGSVMPLISGVGRFKIAASGVLAYQPTAGKLDRRRLMTVTRRGETKPLSPVRRAFQRGLTGSADGILLAITTWESAQLPRIWLFELATGLIRPVTSADTVSLGPAISPDGQQLSYVRWDSKNPVIMVVSTDGGGEAEELLSFDLSAGWTFVDCWTNDGAAVLITRIERAENDSDILRLDLESKQIAPVLSSAASEKEARLSPDGKWLLYSSDETGEDHLHLRAYDAESGTVGSSLQVTVESGASGASWSADGGKIYFVNQDDHLLAVTVTTDPALKLSEPETVLAVDELRSVKNQILPLPDGKRFVFVQKGEDEKEAKHLNVVLNWFDELSSKVPID